MSRVPIIAAVSFATGALLLLPAGPSLAQTTSPGLLADVIGAGDALTVSGSVRARYEAIDGQVRPGFEAESDLVNLRT
ncbi:MAG: hypothetical protein EON88_36320, partial [Brevundimonas sp.]